MGNNMRLSDDQLDKVSGGYTEGNLVSDFTGYIIKCPNCQNTDESTLAHIPAPENSILTGEYVCKKCGTHFTPKENAN